MNGATALLEAVRGFATLPTVLIAVDFDGTLAPLVDDPMAARALPGSLEVLSDLAGLPDTVVALVSGRDLATLRQLTGVTDPVLLVGSHGGETSYEAHPPALDSLESALFAVLEDELAEVLQAHPQARVERKPHSLVLHTRGLPHEAATTALRAGEDVARRHPELQATPGKQVLELAIRHVGKGVALRELAEERGVDATCYIGDDVTDERAFGQLEPTDLTIRVGPGQTLARHRVENERAVLRVLRALWTLRSGR